MGGRWGFFSYHDIGSVVLQAAYIVIVVIVANGSAGIVYAQTSAHLYALFVGPVTMIFNGSWPDSSARFRFSAARHHTSPELCWMECSPNLAPTLVS